MLGLPRYVVHGAGGGGNAPSLNFNFVDGSAFSPQITFTRASSATLFDSSGTLVYAPMNLLTYSEQFDNAAWDKLNLNTTGTPPWVDVEVAPDGTNTADKITEDTATSSHSISQNVTVSASTTYSFSVFLKTAGRNAYIRYDRTGSSGDNIIVTLDLSTGTVVSAVASGIATLSGSSIVPVGNGWYRCTLSGSLGANTDGRVRVFLLDGTTVTYTGDGTSGIYIWGAQLNQTPMQGGVTGDLSTYYPTTSAAYQGPRLDYDPATLAAQGLLLEEQRTNLLTRSEEFNDAAWTKSNATITANATTSPDGTATADKLVEALDVNLVHSCLQLAVTVVSLGTYAATVFVKADTRTRVRIGYLVGGAGGVVADANLSAGTIGAASAFGGGTAVSSSIQAINNGWFRISVVGSGPAGTSGDVRIELLDASGNRQYNGDGVSGVYIWGAQLEAGAFPTSYIPTTTTALTRSADVASVNTLSPWYNATEGTIFVEASPQASNVASVLLTDLNTAVTDRISLAKLITSGNASLAVLVANVTQVSTNNGPWTATGKLAGAYKLNDFASSFNGSAAATDTSGTIPAVTQLFLGRRADGANILNGHIRHITYYPRRLTDTQLQQITA